MNPAILIDLDGTLVDCSHRIHHFHNKEYDDFFNKIPLDIPNSWCLEVIDSFKATHKILLITARPLKTTLLTRSWLVRHGIYHDQLFITSSGMFISDDEIKRRMYKDRVAPFYKVSFVIDDRSHVVKMWRDLGLVCLQCAEGNY